MSGTISFNPFTTSQPSDSFLLQTQGLIQGTVYDDPTARLQLAGGTLYTSESVVMWGGRPVNEYIIVAGSSADALGPVLRTPTTQATCTGFSVFTQAGSYVITPGNSAPSAATGNYVAFFRNGSNARIAVAIDPALYTALAASDGDISSQALYWDVTNYRVTLVTSGGNWALPTSYRLLSVQTNSKIVTYTSSLPIWATGDAGILLI